MNNSTLKIRRGKSYLLNFSKSVFHALPLKLLYACVTCSLSQVVPFASRPSAIWYTLKSPSHCWFAKWPVRPQNGSSGVSSILGLSNVHLPVSPWPLQHWLVTIETGLLNLVTHWTLLCSRRTFEAMGWNLWDRTRCCLLGLAIPGLPGNQGNNDSWCDFMVFFTKTAFEYGTQIHSCSLLWLPMYPFFFAPETRVDPGPIGWIELTWLLTLQEF